MKQQQQLEREKVLRPGVAWRVSIEHFLRMAFDRAVATRFGVAILLCVSITCGRPISAEPPAAHVLAEYQQSQPRDVLLVPVTIAGRTYTFDVDTGSSRSEVDSSLRRILGPEISAERVSTPHGIDLLHVYRAPRMSIGNVVLPQTEGIYCSDLGFSRRIHGEPIDGTLGVDALRQLVLNIDFDEGVLRLLRDADQLPGQRVPLHFRAGVPFVEARLDRNDRDEFLVDTGQGGLCAGSLRAPLFQRLANDGRLEIAGMTTVSSGGNSSRFVRARLRGLSLADQRHTGLEFLRMPMSSLGLDYWSRYTVTLDFPRAILYLTPGKQYSRPETHDLSGLHLLREQGQVVVAAIDTGSAAERCGLRPGDRILAIDGTHTSDLTMFAVRQRFHTGRRTILVVIRRSATELEVDLSLPFDTGG